MGLPIVDRRQEYRQKNRIVRGNGTGPRRRRGHHHHRRLAAALRALFGRGPGTRRRRHGSRLLGPLPRASARRGGAGGGRVGRDPLRLPRARPPRGAARRRAGFPRLRRRWAGLLEVPTFMAVAGADGRVGRGAAVAFARAAGWIVDVRMYDQLFHEVCFEPERERVIADVVAWLRGGFGGTAARDPYA